MGCDAYADEEGIIWIKICSYDDPTNKSKQKEGVACGFNPNERLSVEWIRGGLR